MGKIASCVIPVFLAVSLGNFGWASGNALGNPTENLYDFPVAL